jgi:hypothetical protein
MGVFIFILILVMPLVLLSFIILLLNKLEEFKWEKILKRQEKARKKWAKHYRHFLEAQWDEYNKAYEEYLKTPESAYRPFDRIPPPAAFCY